VGVKTESKTVDSLGSGSWSVPFGIHL